MADGGRDNNDLYSFDYPEVHRGQLEAWMADAGGDKVNSGGDKVNGHGTQANGDDSRPNGHGSKVTGNDYITDDGVPMKDDPRHPKGPTPEPEPLDVRHEAYVPVHTPSPPLNLSREQREFDDRIRQECTKRSANEERAHDDRVQRLQVDLDAAKARREEAASLAVLEAQLDQKLQTRRSGLEAARSAYKMGMSYAFPEPWSVAQRHMLLQHAHLLDEYFAQVKETKELLQKCIEWTRTQIQEGNRMDTEIFRINEDLNEVEGIWKKDTEAGGDQKLLQEMLDGDFATLVQQTIAKDNGKVVDSQRLSKLAPALEDAVAEHPHLKIAWENLVTMEYRSFPERFPEQLCVRRGSDESTLLSSGNGHSAERRGLC